MKKIATLSFLGLTLAFLVISCQKNNVKPTGQAIPPLLPSQTYNYVDLADLPSHMNHLEDDVNPRELSNEIVTLGRVLFYDNLLSLNNSVSCGTCHKQEFGFAEPKQFSTGFEHLNTTRNSMQIVNIRRNENLFWDLRAKSLPEQVTMPVMNHIEMGFESINDLTAKLAEVDYYAPLFAAAYGNSVISESRISEALAGFIMSMVSYNSKYDVGMQSGFNNFTDDEELGRELFMNTLRCGNCHNSRDFKSSWGQSANVGLDEVYDDNGVGALLGNEEQNGAFKIPSLRNVALTAPYMHDGRFATLEEVVDHYSDGIQDHPNLDWSLSEAVPLVFGDDFDPTLPQIDVFPVPTGDERVPKKFNLTPHEKKALIAFLHTLTDHEFTGDPKFSNPFDY